MRLNLWFVTLCSILVLLGVCRCNHMLWHTMLFRDPLTLTYYATPWSAYFDILCYSIICNTIHYRPLATTAIIYSSLIEFTFSVQFNIFLPCSIGQYFIHCVNWFFFLWYFYNVCCTSSTLYSLLSSLLCSLLHS